MKSDANAHLEMDDIVRAAGKTAALVRLLVESSLRFENAKAELELPLAEIDGATIRDFLNLPLEEAEIEALAIRIGLWAGAGHFVSLTRSSEVTLVETGLSALMRPISEGAR